MSRKDIKKKYVHLTNFSVNKNSPNFVKNQDGKIDGLKYKYLIYIGYGSKWSHTALR